MAALGGAYLLAGAGAHLRAAPMEDPALFGLALLALFVIVASMLPSRPGDYAGAPGRATAWLAIGGMALGAYEYSAATGGTASDRIRLPTTIAATAVASGEAELERTYDGHFRARAEIGAAEVGLMLDTGASIVLLRHDDAERIGLDVENLRYTTPVTTANGRTEVAQVTLASVRIGGVVVENVRAAVARKGRLHTSLLGMSFLGELREVVIRGDRVILRN